jgi:cold-inducible RNA-binding protein
MQNVQNNKLFIGNLSYSADVNELKNIFTEFGEVLEVSIPSDRTTGRPRGFAFVTMSNAEEAKGALELDGRKVLGRPIAVSIAHSKRSGGNHDE